MLVDIPLLLHSLSEFKELLFELFELAKVRTIVEIGSEFGTFTKELVEYVTKKNGMLYCIEPKPSQAVVQMCEKSSYIQLIQNKSLDVLLSLEVCDVYLIDGDHNYYTVLNELKNIQKQVNIFHKQPLIILHDIAWPCSRRDCYYSPDDIPDAMLHTYSYEKGVTLNSQNLITGGFRGEGAFAWALDEGGKNNGVLTAVEDFLEQNKNWSLIEVPCIFGLGIMVSNLAPCSDLILNYMNNFNKAKFLLTKLELNRLALYLQVIHLQDLMAIDRRKIEDLENHIINSNNLSDTTGNISGKMIKKIKNKIRFLLVKFKNYKKI